MTLFDLPDGQDWWVARSRKQGQDGPFHVWELTWGADEAEGIHHLEASDASLTQTLAMVAKRRGEIDDVADFSPLSTTLERESLTKVTTLSDIETIDPTLAGMLAEHAMFTEEFKESGPRVIGGGVAFLEAK